MSEQAAGKSSIAIHGAAGRMGRQLLAALAERNDLALGAAIERAGTEAVGLRASVLCPEINTDDHENVTVTDNIDEVLQDFGVLVDFTRPESTLAVLDKLRNSDRAMVIGTTGFSDTQKQQISHAAETIPVLFAPNFSVGVTVSLNLLARAAAALGDDYDVEIIEAHHRHKVDAPSGTALAMGEAVAAALDRKLSDCAVYGREGHTGERDPQTIGFETIRGGDIIGEHTVLFAGMGERIEIVHKATDRMTFARGAIRAAGWLATQPAGLYDMTDVLGLSRRANPNE